jgi:hypothetical protein
MAKCPFCDRIPNGCLTIAGLTRAVFRLNHTQLVNEYGGCAERELWDVFHHYVADLLEVDPECLARDSKIGDLARSLY